MDVIATKAFSSTTHGNVVEGQKLPCTDALGKHYIDIGLAKLPTYQTKVVREVPTVSGAEKPSVSSPVAQVSTEKTQRKQKKKAK